MIRLLAKASAAVGAYGLFMANSRAARFDAEKVSTARHAICILYPHQDSEAYGVISFSQENMISPTKVVASVRGLNPNSTFGMQLLEHGDLSEGPKSLGSSFNTTGSQSQADENKNFYYRHAGDLGAIMTNEKGAGYSAFTNQYIKLYGDSNVYGRSCAIFSEANDPATSLNRGNVLAAGVIGRSSAFKNMPPL
jgi:Cu/Zn superoxide dismutase